MAQLRQSGKKIVRTLIPLDRRVRCWKYDELEVGPVPTVSVIVTEVCALDLNTRARAV